MARCAAFASARGRFSATRRRLVDFSPLSLFNRSNRYSLFASNSAAWRTFHARLRPFKVMSAGQISASRAPEAPSAETIAWMTRSKLRSFISLSLPQPTSNRRCALIPGTSCNSRVWPSLPSMSPRFRIAPRNPLPASSTRWPLAESLRVADTVTTRQAPRAFSGAVNFNLNSMIFPVLVAQITR